MIVKTKSNHRMEELISSIVERKLATFLYEGEIDEKGLTTFTTIIDKIVGYNSGLFLHEKTIGDFIAFLSKSSEIEFQVIDLVAKISNALDTAEVYLDVFIEQWVKNFEIKKLFTEELSLLPIEIKDNITSAYTNTEAFLEANKWWAILYLVNLYCNINELKKVIEVNNGD